MKTLKQITFALVLLVSFNTFASTTCIEDTEAIKTELMKKMAEDEHVTSLLVNLTILPLLESAKAEFNLSGEKYNINYEDVAKGLNSDVKNIKAKFPEFYNLDKQDQVDVLNGAKRLSTKVKNTVICAIAGVTAAVTNCGYQYGRWTARKFAACMATGGIGIVGVEIATDGANSGAVEVEIRGLSRACFRFALKLSRAQAIDLVDCFIAGFLADIVGCATVYGLS